MNSLFESFKLMFEGLSIWGWIGQISGLIGFLIILISFQCNKKKLLFVSWYIDDSFSYRIYIIKSFNGKFHGLSCFAYKKFMDVF